MSPKRSRDEGKKNVPDDEWEALEYISGFGNRCVTEAIKGALPVGQNSPQKVPFGLYAEQVSGTAFTCPRSTNQTTWLYRMSPSVCQSSYQPAEKHLLSASFEVADPSPKRWSPMDLPSGSAVVDFVDGLETICGAGSPELKDGVAIHRYVCNAPMTDRAFCNADGDLLVVPQLGVLHVTTELGRLRVAPGEIVVLPRNLHFSISPSDGARAAGGCRGYALEVFTGERLRLTSCDEPQ